MEAADLKTCDGCKREKQITKAVKERLPGRPANNGRSHAFGGPTRIWCAECRRVHRGKWKEVK